MKAPQIDETKLAEVMELIESAAGLMEEKDCEADREAKKELRDLQSRLEEITGNKKIKISSYCAYWSYASLETVARQALLLPPRKSNLTDAQLAEIIRSIYTVKFREAEMDYFLEVLRVETGLDDVSDYIFEPTLKGLDMQASADEIIEKIMAERAICF